MDDIDVAAANYHPNPAGTDIGALLTPPAGLTEGLASIGREKTAASEKVIDDTEKTLQQDQFRTAKAYDATGIGPDALKPWNADEQQRKFSHEPLEAFGSLGSVVGILASAFVHAPMENAMNASAAAINAVKAGDDKAYERAHQAWKENLDLVYKRHDMMRESYTDAITLMKTNLSAGEARMKMEAARYGDKQAQFLLENGMSEELFKLMDSRNKSITSAVEASDKINESTLKHKAYDSIAKGIDDAAKQSGDGGQPANPTEVAGRKLQAFNRIFKPKTDTPAQEILGIKLAHEPFISAENLAKFANEQNLLPHYGRGGTDASIIEALKAEHEAQGLPPPTSTEIAEAISKKKPPGGVVTDARERAQEVKSYGERLAAEKNEDGTPKYTPDQIADMKAGRDKELKTKAASPSGNRVDDMRRREDQLETAVQHIDRASALLKKHNAISGIGGSILRRGETVASILGSNSTDWHEFESEVATIKQLEPRLLLDATGRPLAGEQDLREKIVRGLGAGDTKKITAERFLQLRRDFIDALERTRKRRMGGDTNPDRPASDSDSKKPWETAPIVKPRADIESEEASV